MSVVARPAATILLLRDGPSGLEVLMVERNVASEFASGALVFPGGRVDAADHAGGDLEYGLRVAGIRETWEEARMLLARPRGGVDLLSAGELATLERRLAVKLGRRPDFADFVGSGEVVLAIDLMVRSARWITPEGRPKRYDTHFFLAPMPADQRPQGDGHEAVSTVWISPAEALAGGESGRFTVVFPTRLNLLRLARDDGVAAALARAAGETVVTVCPEMLQIEGRRVLRLPIEAGYGGPDFDVSDIPMS